MAKRAKFQIGSNMLKSPKPVLCKNGKMSKIPYWNIYGKITHTEPMQKWQNEQNSKLCLIWQNHLYPSYAKLTKKQNSRLGQIWQNHPYWSYGSINGKRAKFQTGWNMAKSPIPVLWKSGKMSKIPDWVKYGKITHTGPMEKWQHEQISRLGKIWLNHHTGPMETWQNEQKSRLGKIWQKHHTGRLKNGKTGKIPHWVKYDKITHTGEANDTAVTAVTCITGHPGLESVSQRTSMDSASCIHVLLVQAGTWKFIFISIVT